MLVESYHSFILVFNFTSYYIYNINIKCMKCILDRINRNGYVIVAIYGMHVQSVIYMYRIHSCDCFLITGWPFCAASMKGIAIIFKNFIRAAALDMVSGYLQMLGRICILSVNTGLITFIAIYWYDDKLYSPVNPAMGALCITFFVCWQYMHLYEVGLSTIFICFLIDEERNKNTGFMRASKKLRRIIGDTTVSKATIKKNLKSTRHMDKRSAKQAEWVDHDMEITAKERKIFSGLDDDESQSHSLSLSSNHETHVELPTKR